MPMFVEKLHKMIKTIVMLSMKLEEKKQEYDMPKLIIGNMNIMRQYSAAFYMLEENYNQFNVNDLLMHENLYDTMDIKMEYTYKDESKKVVTAMRCNNEELTVETPHPGATL